MEAVLKDILQEVIFEKNQTLNDTLYYGFHGSILKGKLKKGDRINLSHYAEMFNVSRTPVRQALLRVESDGLVRKDPNHGFIVEYSSIDASNQLQEVIELKKLLSINCVELNYNVVSASKKDSWRSILETLIDADVSGDAERFLEVFRFFNADISCFNNNHMFCEVISILDKYVFQHEKKVISDTQCRGSLIETISLLVSNTSSLDMIKECIASIYRIFSENVDM